MVLYEGIPPCRCGGIGRRTGLKIPRRKSYGFDPRHRYHVRRSKHRSVSALRRKLHYVSSFFLTNSSLWETGSDYLFCPLSAQPKPGAAVRARECRKVFFRTMQRCFFSHHCAFGDRRRADTACACPPVWILKYRLRLGENGAHVGHFFAERERDGLAVVGEPVGFAALALAQQIGEQER